jgi:hypothetical protein
MQTMLVAERRDAHIRASLSTSTGLQFCGFPNNKILLKQASTYGSEMLVMRISIEMIEGLRYKLCMLGVPIDGGCNVFCDNNGMVLNMTVPELNLKKKHAAMNYHRVRESIAARTIRVAKEDTRTNLADVFTKLLDGVTLRFLMLRLLW